MLDNPLEQKQLRGFVEGIIPQRVYENIHIHYDFDDDVGRLMAIDQLIKDMIKYHQAVSRIHANNMACPDCDTKDKEEQVMGDEMEAEYPDKILSVTEKCTIDGVDYRKRKGKWEYWERGMSFNQWLPLKEEDLERMGFKNGA